MGFGQARLMDRLAGEIKMIPALRMGGEALGLDLV